MIIGISGKAQTGKDTICKIIQSLYIYEQFKMGKIDPRCSSCKNEMDFVTQAVSGKFGELSPTNWQKHAFADRLKEMASLLIGVDRQLWEDGKFKDSKMPIEWGRLKTFVNEDAEIGIPEEYETYERFTCMKYREVLQGLGNGLREHLHPNVWVNTLMSEYDNKSRIPLDWIVTDVRMKNEAEAIVKRGGILLRVERNTGYNDNHISETDLDSYPFEYILYNNSDLETLIMDVKYFYETIINDR